MRSYGMRIRDTPDFPFTAMRRVGEDPVIEALRAMRRQTITRMVRNPARERLNGKKGSATRMGLNLAKRLFGC